MTDNRPEPKYGQYAPIPPVEPAPPPPLADVGLPPVRVRRNWDVLLTTALLLLGVYDVATGYGYFADLAATMRTLYSDQGFGEFTSDELASTAGLVVNIARIILIAVAIIVSLLLISRNRRAFWVPLTAGAVAAIVVFACVLVVVVSDPALAQYVSEQSVAP